MATTFYSSTYNQPNPELLCELTESFRVISLETKDTAADKMPMYFELLASSKVALLMAIQREASKGEVGGVVEGNGNGN